jgi:hypothetical protein
MNDYEIEQRLEAQRLRAEAALDDVRAEQAGDDNPMYAEHCRRRAEWKRHLANNRDGGR